MTSSNRCPDCGQPHFPKEVTCRNCDVNLEEARLRAYTREYLEKQASDSASGHDARCPSCGQQDKVKKVSAIVVEQSQSIHGTYRAPVYEGGERIGSEARHYYAASALADLFAAPVKPEQKPGFPFIVWLVVIPSMIGAPLGILISLFGMITNDSNIVGAEGFLVGILITATVVWVFKENPKREARNRALHKKELDIWNKKMQKWESLYYCERDELVFNPGTGESFPPSLLKGYLAL